MKLHALAALVCLLPLAVTSCSGDDTTPPAEAGPDGTTPHQEGGAADTGTKDQQTPQPDVVTEATTPEGGQGDVVVPSEASPDGGPGVTDATVDVTDGGPGADTGPDVVVLPDESATLNLTAGGALAKAASDVDAKLLSVLPTVAGVVNMFVDESATDATLRPSESAFNNAGYIRIRLGNVLNGTSCTDDTHTGNETVYTDFSDCIVNGLRVKGRVEAEAVKVGTALSVSFTFTNFSVNGIELADTSTVVVKPTGTAYPTDMSLVVGGIGTLVLTNGTATVSEPDGGSRIASAGGSGTLLGLAGSDAGDAGMPILTSSSNGWNCTQKSVLPAFTTTANLVSTLGACLPNGGSATVTRTFDCHKSGGGVLRPDQTVVATTVLDWQSNTPATGVIKVKPDSDIGDAGTVSSLDITLPTTCQNQIVGPEVQPEAGPDAEHDAADAAGE